MDEVVGKGVRGRCLNYPIFSDLDFYVLKLELLSRNAEIGAKLSIFGFCDLTIADICALQSFVHDLCEIEMEFFSRKDRNG